MGSGLQGHLEFLKRTTSDTVTYPLIHISNYCTDERIIYDLGNHEKIPYDSSSIRSIYHIREYCVRKLSLVCSYIPHETHVNPPYSCLHLKYFFPMIGLNLSSIMVIFPAFFVGRNSSVETSSLEPWDPHL
jgi:hypothetical protein